MTVRSTEDRSEGSPGLLPAPPPTLAGRILYNEHHRLNPSPIIPPETTVPSNNSNTSSAQLNNESAVDKGKDKEVERGRTVERRPMYANPLAKAESRLRMNDAAIEVDVRPIEKRTLSRSSTFSHFDDPTDPCAVLEDDLLEPCPHVPVCSTVYEVLNTPLDASGIRATKAARSSANDSPGSWNIRKPARALTVDLSESRPLYPAPVTQSETMTQMFPDVDHRESFIITPSPLVYNTTQSFSDLPLDTPNAPASLGAQLPTEILQQIFYMLSPADFNSSRHTCRSWFISSLERSILEVMMSRGGWSSSIQRDIAANRALDSEARINDEWLMSKRISRECALGPDWTGNGISDSTEYQSLPSNKSGFVCTCIVDFTDIPVHNPGKSASGTIFTVSTCGKFLMAANGCLIYIYEMNRSHRPKDGDQVVHPGSLRPVTSIICPGRVIACSMDTSSYRYAIAVLLDGRMGLVCDITPNRIAPPAALRNADNPESDNLPNKSVASAEKSREAESPQGPSFLERVSLNSSASNPVSGRPTSDLPFVFPVIATTATSNPDESTWQDVFRSYIPQSMGTAVSSSRLPSLSRAQAMGMESGLYSMLPPFQGKVHANTMPIEIGPRSLYRNLCSDDDPPRSVAICPQRRCVAYGCSAGIELHWVDALTGQDLNRWFPLTAPSDYLFFLPPRTSVDSAKKLRLISSAAKPSERAAISQRAFGGTSQNSPFWERFNYGALIEENNAEANSDQSLLLRLRASTHSRAFAGRMDCSDHYRAVPLSDGYHVLFTDPTTGLLCLGSDAPVGGPLKLLRKIWFQGPEGKGSPVAYASGSDMSWGVRVIAAFGAGPEQSIWFFSVPADVFAANKGSQSIFGGSYDKTSSSGKSRNMDWVDWWPDRGLYEWLNNAQETMPGVLPRSVWPVKIRGQEIGTCPLLVDLAVDSGPSLTVWAFSKEGIARVWRIDDGKDGNVRNIRVVRDGTIRERDGEGDLEMSDSSGSTPELLESPLSLTQESFDGATSLNKATTLATRFVRRSSIDEGSQQRVNYDSEGDVIMEDVDSSDYYQAWPPDSFEAVVFLQHQDGNLYRTSRGSGESLESIGSDLIEGLAGVTRIEIEIR